MSAEDREVAKLLRRVDRAVRAIPTDGTWFKDANRATFVRVAADLIDRGLPEKHVIEYLQKLYTAVASENGD